MMRTRRALGALGAAVWLTGCIGGEQTAVASPSRCELDSLMLANSARAGLQQAGVRAPATSGRMELRQHKLVLPSGEARVFVTASWGGPSNGVALLADCGGHVLDADHVGYVRQVSTLDSAPGRTLEEVIAITGTGTGWRQESIALFAPTASELHLTWSGVREERSYQTAEVGAYEETGDLAYVGPDSLVHRLVTYPLTPSERGDWVRGDRRVQARTFYWNRQMRAYDEKEERADRSNRIAAAPFVRNSASAATPP